MTAYQYCKKYSVSAKRLMELLKVLSLSSDYILTDAEQLLYPESLKPAIKAKGRKPKRKLSLHSSPFERNGNLFSARIVRK